MFFIITIIYNIRSQAKVGLNPVLNLNFSKLNTFFLTCKDFRKNLMIFSNSETFYIFGVHFKDHGKETIPD